MRRLAILLGAFTAAVLFWPAAAAVDAPPNGHVQMYGFSQVMQFHSEMAHDWCLTFKGGAELQKWKNPTFAGWTGEKAGDCSVAPTAVLFVVSNGGVTGNDLVADMQTVLQNIEAKHPGLPVWFMAVVGGDGTCNVRADRQHDGVVDAIGQVVGAAAGPDVQVGCSGFSDRVGHLTPEGRVEAAVQVDAWADGTPTTTTTITTTTTTTAVGGCDWPAIRSLLVRAEESYSRSQVQTLLSEAVSLGDAGCS